MAAKAGAAKVREKSNAVKDLVNTVCIQQGKIVGRIAGLSRGARGLKLLSNIIVLGKWQPVGESNPSYQVENLVS